MSMGDDKKELCDAIVEALKKFGNPGGFVILMEAPNDGPTALLSTVSVEDTLHVLISAHNELKLAFGPGGGTKQ